MDHKKIPVKPEWNNGALIDQVQYEKMYEASIANSENFWREQAKILNWRHFPKKIKDVNFSDHAKIKWFEDGELNVAENCIDRHLPHRAKQIAILWESDDGKESRRITYGELHEEVCRMANMLQRLNIKKGDRVTIYMPMIPEAAFAMLACARIGAIHSVVFGGFSPEALLGRIQDCDSTCIITADEGWRGGKKVPLKRNVDQALEQNTTIKSVVVIRRTGGNINWVNGRDHWYHEWREKVDPVCSAPAMNAEDPLFILYTSGSTGKPKGVLHTSGGYLLYAAITHRYVFDYREGEVYWCTADVGWVTGHSYIVYGPLANGATTLMFEGIPNYPSPDRFWKVIDKYAVNIFYTAPTAIRALMREGDKWLESSSRQSLRVMGSVGEPINPEAWLWYYSKVGKERAAIVDTWWQTETGGVLISPLPGATDLKPGSATKPLFGIKPEIVDAQGTVLSGEAEGNLVIADSWPGQARSVYRDHQRFVETYFKTYPGKYFTGDGARRDADGYHWITGRVDDVINVAGHRLGTAEIESALVSHQAVAEAAVVGFPHDIKGQGIYAFVILKDGIEQHSNLAQELIATVRREISPIATPDKIQLVPGLPKTRSGKIMRRILRKIAEGHSEGFGDVSTLADPAIVDVIVKSR